MNPHLDRLASRVVDNPTFLASALAAYARSERIEDAVLAQRLGCATATLAPMRLCRMPRMEVFLEDIERIAERFSLSVDALLEAVRRGQALMQMQAAAQSAPPSALLAARDQKPPQLPARGESE